LREILNIPATIAAIRNAHRQWPDIDLIHINEFTGIFPMWIAKRMYQVPVVVHVRSVARNDDRSWRTTWVNSFLRRNASAIIAIDETVRQSLPADLDVEVIHNAFTPKPIADPDPAFRTAMARTRPGSLKVGFVGNLLKVKGILDLVEAARILKDGGVDVEYVIIGDDARSSKTMLARILSLIGINQNIRAEVEERLQSYDLAKDFHLVGFMSDIAQAYRSMDVLCFPSHYNAPGRPVFEAAFSAIPSIVAVTNPTKDTLIDGETALAVPPHDPKRLAAAISTLANDRDRSRKMGLAAFELAKINFSVDQNALKLYAVFRRCLGLSE
jgi:glycosyltransferase involved in cell wall biosynthesis